MDVDWTLGSTSEGENDDASTSPLDSSSLDSSSLDSSSRDDSGVDTSSDSNRTPHPDVFDLHVGERLDDYRIEGLLGAGGMGRVFEAQHVQTGEVVALKLLNCSETGHLTRFKREFRVLADVSHPNLIRLGQLRVLTETRAYITMERIRGRPFVEWVRRRTPTGRLPNLLRLQRAMRQLIAGTSRLHHEQCIHRDLKPSNVLITDEGRVVILDFGLIRESQSGTPTLTRDGQVLGTPSHMAPEQAGRDSSVGPAADWYAVGVMLFECLTGVRPFEGSAATIMIAKRTRDAPNPGAMVYGMPEPLRELCVRLLARDPAARPSEGELIAVFGEVSGPLPAALELPAFVGRVRELECLREARREVRASAAPVVVRIVGEAGLGKSTLVRHFFREFVDQPEVTTLRCRCLERESLPYKGIDGIVDALAVLIRRMSEVEAASLQPRQLGALARIFPALASAWGPRPRTLDAEPKELRRMGGAALREVFQRLADRRQLILAIDDFQWADVDSARLLLEILGPPDPPAILLILGHTDVRGEALELLDRYDAFAGIRVDEIQLGPLSRDEAEQLVHALTPGDELGDEQLEQLLHRSEGSPLLVQQLARVDVGVALDDAADRLIVRRVLELPSAQRQLLEQIAVASGPLSRATIDSLTDTAQADLAALVESGLIRRESLAAGEQLETAHARIRELVVAELTPNELSRRHRELAKVLEQHGAEPEAIAEHWEQGRRPHLAANWAEQAARRAASMLAFARAAAAYRRALRALGNLTIGPVDELREQLAEQLIALGEVREAADLLIELATRASPERASALRRRVAWLLLEDGRIEEAFPLIAEQLEQVGEALPHERWRIALGLIRDRAALALRGLEFEPRPESEVDPDQLARVDTLSTFVTLLSQYGHHPRAALISSALRARLLRLALAAGEPGRVAYSLAHEGLILAASGKTELGDRLVERGCRLLPESSADSTAALRVRQVEAMLYFMTGRWPRASERIDALVELSEHTASGWLRPQLLARRAQLWLVCGRFNELRRTLPRELAAMRERGNVYNLSRLVSVDVELCLYEGRITEAEERLAKFLADWPTTFHTFETIWLQMAEINVALFRGELEQAQRLNAAMLAAAREHQVHRISMMRLYFENLQARVLAAALIEEPRSAPLRRGLRRAIRALHGSDKPMFVGMAASARALLRELEGDEGGARRAWLASARAFQQCGMAARAAAAQMRVADRVADGYAYFERERVAGWHRFIEVFAASKHEVPDDLASISRVSSIDGE